MLHRSFASTVVFLIVSANAALILGLVRPMTGVTEPTRTKWVRHSSLVTILSFILISKVRNQKNELYRMKFLIDN